MMRKDAIGRREVVVSMTSGADDGDRDLGLDPALTEILYYASLAPSGHNTQPWHVRVLSRDHLVIGVDPTRALPRSIRRTASSSSPSARSSRT